VKSFVQQDDSELGDAMDIFNKFYSKFCMIRTNVIV